MTALAGCFDDALGGVPSMLVHDDGTRTPLAVERWQASPDVGDEVLLLQHCTGPTIDVGCGPGRLAAALAARGVVALGVDSSPLAVALTRDRGGVAVHRDVHDPLPGERSWNHVLLADGNIGIGGDPVRLLRRAGELLRPDGTVLAELDAPGVGFRSGTARLVRGGEVGPWFPWCRLGADAVATTAARAGLHVRGVTRHGDRWAAALQRS